VPLQIGYIGRVLVLAHVDFSPVSLETDLIHQLIDQENSSPVVGVHILAHQGIGNLHGIKAGAGVFHHDEKTVFLIARNAALHFFGGIVLTAMENGVSQRLAQRRFNLKFLAGSAIHAAGHLHDALNHRTDSGRVGVERNLDTYHQFVVIKLNRRIAARRLGASLSGIASVTLTGMILLVKRESQR